MYESFLIGLVIGFYLGTLVSLAYNFQIGLVIGLISMVLFIVTNSITVSSTQLKKELKKIDSPEILDTGVFSLLYINKIVMVDKLTWSWKNIRLVTIVAVFFGLLGGFLTMIFMDIFYAILGGLFIGLISGLFYGFFLILMPIQVEEAAYPGQRLKNTFHNALSIYISTTLLFGLLGGLLGKLFGELIGGLIIGTTNGLTFGMVFGLGLYRHYLLRFILVMYKLFPLHVILFLTFATDIIFLRRIGGSYIFIYRALMEHFAEMDLC